MKKLLLISPLSTRSLMGGGFFFRMPCLGLLKVAALTPPGLGGDASSMRRWNRWI